MDVNDFEQEKMLKPGKKAFQGHQGGGEGHQNYSVLTGSISTFSPPHPKRKG
jgi:hypothetical protein